MKLQPAFKAHRQGGEVPPTNRGVRSMRSRYGVPIKDMECRAVCHDTPKRESVVRGNNRKFQVRYRALRDPIQLFAEAHFFLRVEVPVLRQEALYLGKQAIDSCRTTVRGDVVKFRQPPADRTKTPATFRM